MNEIFSGLFLPLTPTELAFLNAMAEGGVLEPHQVFENPREISEFASRVLIFAEYCSHCGHRQKYHDGGLGNCHYDGCGCQCFFETKAAE